MTKPEVYAHLMTPKQRQKAIRLWDERLCYLMKGEAA